MKLLRNLRPRIEVDAAADGATVRLMRGHRLSDSLRLGRNEVHFAILHPDGSYEDLGISPNLLTTVGRDLLSAGLGNFAGKEGAMTAATATSATPAGGGMTVDAYKGHRVWAAAALITSPSSYGNIGSNSATVLTIDQWWTAADGVATTPAATNGYHIQPSVLARFMGVTADVSAASAASTVLTGEITINGLTRALAAYAHTGGTATYTLTKTFSVTGGPQTVHRGGLFTAANTTAAGVLVFETVANVDAIVTTSDSLVATWTVTLSG